MNKESLSLALSLSPFCRWALTRLICKWTQSDFMYGQSVSDGERRLLHFPLTRFTIRESITVAFYYYHNPSFLSQKVIIFLSTYLIVYDYDLWHEMVMLFAGAVLPAAGPWAYYRVRARGGPLGPCYKISNPEYPIKIRFFYQIS